MRFQAVYHTVKNRWVIMIICLWTLIAAVAVSSLVLWVKSLAMQDEQITLAQYIEKLEKKKQFFENHPGNLQSDDVRLTAILTDLMEAREKSRIQLLETSISEEMTLETHTVISVTISVRGTYNQIGMFVNLLEKNQHFKVVDLNMSTKQKERSGIIGKINAEFIRV